MYLTYEEYTQMGGESLEVTAFEQLEFEARTQIDWWTFGRLKNEASYPEAVKRCMYRLIEYNVITGNMAMRVIQAQLNNTIRMYLQDVKDSLGRKVLYRGLYPGE